jgi:hypothetical protein
MVKDFRSINIPMPDFGDASTFMKTLGTIVVKEIVAMIDREEQPDGSPQKQNSPEYAKRKQMIKGYSTPLKGLNPESPYLARESTFVKDFIPPGMLVIHLNQKRADIGVRLTDNGYWFMGITDGARDGIRERARRYFNLKMKQMAGQKNAFTG